MKISEAKANDLTVHTCFCNNKHIIQARVHHGKETMLNILILIIIVISHYFYEQQQQQQH